MRLARWMSMNCRPRMMLALALAGMMPAAAAFAWKAGDEARVNADRVNMRSRPGLNYEVVLQLGYGDVLTVAELEGEEWVGVVPPAGAHAWVHKDYVRDGKVSVARLDTRSGPGINYTVLGRMGRGAEIVPVEEFGEWIKIVAPADARLWVHKDFLEPVTPPPAATPTTGPDVGWVTMPAAGTSPDAPTPVVSVTPVASGHVRISTEDMAVAQATLPEPVPPGTNDDDLPYPAPEGLDLVPLGGQGDTGRYDGILSRVKYLIGRPSRYELVDERDGRQVTVCYVRGNRDQLSGFIGRRLRVEGKTYWVQDLKYPVIVPAKIHLDPSPVDEP